MEEEKRVYLSREEFDALTDEEKADYLDSLKTLVEQLREISVRVAKDGASSAAEKKAAKAAVKEAAQALDNLIENDEPKVEYKVPGVKAGKVYLLDGEFEIKAGVISIPDTEDFRDAAIGHGLKKAGE